MIFIQFMLGASLASFINVVVDRGLIGQSIVKPRSHCGICGHFLTYYDLVPVVSFLLLKGRCRYCKGKIPQALFLTELILGLIFVETPWGLANLSFLANVTILMGLSRFDIATQQIPRLGIWSLAISCGLSSHHPPFQIGIFLILYLTSQFINKNQSIIGNGDIDILFCLWLATNISLMLWTTCIACVSAIFYLLVSPWPSNNQIPFVPFIMVGYMITNQYQVPLLTLIC